jgi:hypothetical protein
LALDKVQELNRRLAPWELEIDIRLIRDDSGYNVVIVGKKPDGKGFQRIITPASALYYAEDPDTLIRQIAKEAVEFLYEDQVFALLGDVRKALVNVVNLKEPKL